MKQTIKKMLVAILSFAMVVISVTFDVEAAEIPLTPPTLEEYGEPISVTTYVDEDGCTVTERLYFYSDSSSATRSGSGSGWFKQEKEQQWTPAGGTSTYYTQGYFTWGDGDVSVSNPSGGIDYIRNLHTMSNEKVETGHGRYAGIFNNYATVTYSFSMTSAASFTLDYSVTVRVSESGNQI